MSTLKKDKYISTKCLPVPDCTHIIRQAFLLLQQVVEHDRRGSINSKLARQYADRMSRDPLSFRDREQHICYCSDYCGCPANTVDMCRLGHPQIFGNVELMNLLRYGHQLKLKLNSKEYQDHIKEWNPTTPWPHLAYLL